MRSIAKVKEKPCVSNSTKEKIQAAPKEMLRRGFLTGTEKLQGQLRDAAEGGQRQETEIDRAQAAARTGTQRVVYHAKRLAQGKKKIRTGKLETNENMVEASSDSSIPDIQTDQADPHDSVEPARIKTREAVHRSPPPDHRPDASGSEPLQIKTKDAYIQCRTDSQDHKSDIGSTTQQERQASGSTERGRQEFVRERQRKAAEQRKENRRESERGSLARQRDADDVKPRQTPVPSAQNRKLHTENTGQGTASNGNHRIKEARSGAKAVGRTSRQAVKRVESSGKTLQAGGHSAQTMRQAARAAVQARQRAVQAVGATRRTTTTAGKATAKAASSALRGAVSAIRTLIAPLAAGGGSVVAVVLVLCLVGALVMSPLGIFFSRENNGGQTISAVVREINQEYDFRLEEIREGAVYDEVSLSGSHAPWVEILAVYAVKTTSDPANGQEVVTINDEKKAILKQVFWDMNELFSFTSTVPGEGGDGEDTTTLHITVTARTANEMADIYGFNADQRRQLDELLSDEYRKLWNAVLYGTGTDSGEIVAVALSQVGNVGGQPYWSWYGFNSRVEWCACFVSWCANECGYVDAGVIPKFSGCVQGSRWFKDRELWQDRSYTPNPGDIVFFDWDDPGGYSGPQDGVPDHVGIVERVENGRVYTVEGNSDDKCCQRSYPLGHYEIYGYGMLCPQIAP